MIETYYDNMWESQCSVILTAEKHRFFWLMVRCDASTNYTWIGKRFWAVVVINVARLFHAFLRVGCFSVFPESTRVSSTTCLSFDHAYLVQHDFISITSISTFPSNIFCKECIIWWCYQGAPNDILSFSRKVPLDLKDPHLPGSLATQGQIPSIRGADLPTWHKFLVVQADRQKPGPGASGLSFFKVWWHLIRSKTRSHGGNNLHR